MIDIFKISFPPQNKGSFIIILMVCIYFETVSNSQYQNKGC